MFSFEDPDVFNEFINSQLDNPMQYRIDSAGRAVYRCHNNFGHLRDTFARAIPQIVDLGSSGRLHGEEVYGILPIQPNHYCAPEVILGCGWRMSADIWNLGTLVSVPAPQFRRSSSNPDYVTALGYRPRRRAIPTGPHRRWRVQRSVAPRRNDRPTWPATPETRR